MSVKNLALVVVAHEPYIRHISGEGEFPRPENSIFFSALSQTYIPLVNLLHKLEDEHINAKFSLVLTPVICAMLDDEMLKNQYVDWLERCIILGEKEIERLKDEPPLLKNAQEQLKKAVENRENFTQKYNRNLLAQFAQFSKKGMIEILTSCGTHAFLPHYSDLPEILNAQVETGIISHKYYFDTVPYGFWLPYMGYSRGLENVLRSYGVNYTLLNAQSLLFCENPPAAGIFEPVRCNNSLVVFGTDSKIYSELEGESSFSANKIYKNQNRDIGFELDSAQLSDFMKQNSPRLDSLFRYWSKEDDSLVIYDSQKAMEQVKIDAKKFLDSKNKKLECVSSCVNEPSLVCAINASTLGQNWAEGMDFFEQVLRLNCESNFACPEDLIKEQFKLTKVNPYPSAASGQGYGEDLLDSSNSWMVRYTRKMSERMVDLAGRFPDDTGLKARLLILGAKELMLSQSGELAKMIHDGYMPDFAKQTFISSVMDFTTVFDSLGSNVVSTEWLTKIEKEHNLFPWMNYRIFRKKI
ncbi:1,4-alpha-glucan branching protein domain-containing protein [Treponema pectinovorum]|uniref:1,4-alpha-glucan branching protein domain-containing protein n=1 Tax=Treponema pectinovorum TaxID=164 RepID=UPI003D8B1018